MVDLRRVRGQLTKSAGNEKTKDKSNMGRQMRKGKYHSEARISGVLETLRQKSPPNRHVPLNMSKRASLPALLQSAVHLLTQAKDQVDTLLLSFLLHPPLPSTHQPCPGHIYQLLTLCPMSVHTPTTQSALAAPWGLGHVG